MAQLAHIPERVRTDAFQIRHVINVKSIFVLLCMGFLLGCGGKKLPYYPPVELHSANGTVVGDVRIPSRNLGGADGVVTIYLPENYLSSGKTYPVLYLLHGMYGDNNDWVNNGMKTTTDNYIGMGLCPELIVVMPDGNNDFYVNGYTQGIKYETYFHEELIPYIESHYPCRTDRESRAIAGLSMGGFGTVFHAFRHPDKFCVAYSMSGAVGGMGTATCPSLERIFTDEGYTPADYGRLPELTLECGTEDYLCYTANVEAHKYLSSINFAHDYIVRSGSHDWVFWTACYPKVLAKLNKHFKITQTNKNLRL